MPKGKTGGQVIETSSAQAIQGIEAESAIERDDRDSGAEIEEVTQLEIAKTELQKKLHDVDTTAVTAMRLLAEGRDDERSIELA